MKKTLILFSLLILLVGCGSSSVYIPNTLPVNLQQNINTSKNKNIDFQFISFPSDQFTAKANFMCSVTFSVNDPFRGKIRELILTKFSNITDQAKNKILVKTEQINSYTKDKNYIFSMKVSAKMLQDNNVNNQRTFNYTFSVLTGNGSVDDNSRFKREVADNLKQILNKFVISIDKFIDSNKL